MHSYVTGWSSTYAWDFRIEGDKLSLYCDGIRMLSLPPSEWKRMGEIIPSAVAFAEAEEKRSQTA